MEFYCFVSEPKQTAFAPEWRNILGETMLEGIDFNKVKDIVLSKEKDIIEKYPACNRPGSVDGHTNLGPNSLTSRYDSYNLFKWEEPEIQQLFKRVKQKYVQFLNELHVQRTKVWMQSWANVMRKGEQIAAHIHNCTPYSYLSGHITVVAQNTSTVYICPVNQINSPLELARENDIGKLTIFEQCIPHYTTKHEGDSERITIAFDLIVDRDPSLPSDKSALILFDDPDNEL